VLTMPSPDATRPIWISKNNLVWRSLLKTIRGMGVRPWCRPATMGYSKFEEIRVPVQGNMDRSIICHVGALSAGFECHDFCAQYQKIQFRYATSIGTIPRFQFCSQYSRACFRNKNTCHAAVLQQGHRQADGAPVSIQYGRPNSTGKNRMIKKFHTMADSLGEQE
jgi:hypothetical protein